MRIGLILICVFCTLNLYGQKSDIENLINQVAAAEVPENFKYYFLVSKSLDQKEINDSLQNYQLRELKLADQDYKVNFIYSSSKKESISWRDYNLNKAKFVSDDADYNNYLSPPQTKKIKFVRYSIDEKDYNFLVENKEPYTLIIKKKWFWSKSKIWRDSNLNNNLIERWKADDKSNPEETVYFHFSKPIFSENKRYAILSLFKKRRCNGNGFTGFYRNDNGIWKKIMEFNQISSITSSTHLSCEELMKFEFE